MTSSSTFWKIWIDTGGTFTDCIGISPDGNISKVKVLSNSSLRGTITEQLDSRVYKIQQDWQAPSGFVNGFQLKLLSTDHPPAGIAHFDASHSTIEVNQPLQKISLESGMAFEAQSPEEAPILAARLLTQNLPDEPLPDISMRLATTKGTNALLEKTGAPTLFLTTKGFGDLLSIGNQQRDDLFALQIQKPSPLYSHFIEINERIDAEGSVLNALDTSNLPDILEKHLQQPNGSVAVCLMNSYKNSTHEEELKKQLRQAGAEYISISSELGALINILPRAQTTLVNAYLEPVLTQYLDDVRRHIKGNRLHIMTSAGGLSDTETFHPKDSLLSGPAGGVVGASAIGKQAGSDKIISFDMGGTSTDVARFDSDFDYTFQHTVGDAKLNAPALAIETVAAGGGSICEFDGQKLTVEPESAGAHPGPACYGAGGPLTITDVNLLLGRLEPENFGIPISKQAAQTAFEQIFNKIAAENDRPPRRENILEGFLQIANERMADAIRKISMRKGYDPSNYGLVAFGGAGAQHACAIAEELDMSEIIIPADAGLLSAYGLGRAVVEQFAEQQVLQPLSEVKSDIRKIIRNLSAEALEKLSRRVDEEVIIRRKLVFMRLKGQESTLEVPYSKSLKQAFKEAYTQKYGHWISNREIEIESVRVVASTKAEIQQKTAPDVSSRPDADWHKKIQFGLKNIKTPVFQRQQLQPGQTLDGPALVLDPYSTIILPPGWKVEVLENLSLHLRQKTDQTEGKSEQQAESVALELFTNRFTSIAEEMGEMLKRTALSVNIKERMDFSCALLNAQGELIVNAPHIPVHLGALGLCVRKLKDTIDLQSGDVAIANHPAFGGSHLPDITVVTPIFTEDNQLMGYAASRAHHAEIGGSRPGSMPPDAGTLAEEGVVIPPAYLVKNGKARWDWIRNHFTEAAYPTRSIEENIADLQAAVAANNRGVQSLKNLGEVQGTETVLHYMSEIKRQATGKVKKMLLQIEYGNYSSKEFLDDGTILNVSIQKKKDSMHIDFTGTGSVHPGNLNATPAIVNSVIMYVLRVLVDEPLPLNDGLLEPVDITLPECLLNPVFEEFPQQCPAVVGGNTEVSQRLVDLLLKPFKKIACSQGTMNNVLFGNETFGYYETIGGGTGAGAGFDGADAIHHHMTNTAGTDPETLEHRYPVRLDRYSIRKNSGGKGKYQGGNGIMREFTFLEPVSLSVLTQHRKEQPYGLKGGEPGAPGKQWIVRKNGEKEMLTSVDGKELEAGDRFVIHTPGGGGFENKNSKSE